MYVYGAGIPPQGPDEMVHEAGRRGLTGHMSLDTSCTYEVRTTIQGTVHADLPRLCPSTIIHRDLVVSLRIAMGHIALAWMPGWDPGIGIT